MARWLGEATNIGQAMCYYILLKSGVPIVRSTVQPVLEEDKSNETVQQELVELDISIVSKLGDVASQDKEAHYPDYFNMDQDDNEAITPEFDLVDEEPVEDFDPDVLISQHRYSYL